MESQLAQEFCTLITLNDLQKAQKVFKKLHLSIRKLYIIVASKIISNPTLYPEKSNLIARKIIEINKQTSEIIDSNFTSSGKVEIPTHDNLFKFRDKLTTHIDIHVNLNKCPVKILKSLAESLGITNFTNMTKKELVSACNSKIIFKPVSQKYRDKKIDLFTDKIWLEQLKDHINSIGNVSRLYKCESVIGSGAHSVVFKAVSLKNIPVAFKVEIQRGHGQLNLLPIEQQIIRNFKTTDDRLVKNLEVFWNIPYFEKSHPDWKINIIVSPLYLESLDKALIKSPTRQQKLHWAREAIRCIQQAHNIQIHGGVLHRDIKPDNFCLQKDGKLVLIDFGIAEWADMSITKRKAETVVVGTQPYTSVWSESYIPQSYRDDTQSVGFMIWQMLYDFLPWEKNRNYSLKKDSLSLAPEYLKPYFKHCNRLELREKPDYNYLISLFN